MIQCVRIALAEGIFKKSGDVSRLGVSGEANNSNGLGCIKATLAHRNGEHRSAFSGCK